MNCLRHRLFLVFLCVMLLALAIPILYGRQTMHSDVLEDMRAATLREARLAADLLEAQPGIASAGLQKFLSNLGISTGSRFTFVAATGQVLGDSEVAPGDVPTLPIHTDRPEITGALHNGYGSAIRYSVTLHMDQIYAAVAVSSAPERPAGVIRVSVPFAGIANRVDSLAFGLGLGALLVTLLAYVLSRIMLGRLETAIKDMTRVVEYTAPQTLSGVSHPRPTLPPRREFHELSLAVSDMADRVEKQIRTIEAQKAELISILDIMEEGVLVLDQRGHIRRVNPALNRLFPKFLFSAGKLPVEIIPLAELQQAINELLADSQPHSVALMLEYGRDQTLSAQLTRLENNQDIGAVVVLHDVSDMARLIRMKRDLIANASHELRTPLTAIQGYADTLLDVDDEPETRRKFVHIIRKHTAHMVRLVEDLLTLSRLENGEPDLLTDLSVNRLNEALNDAIDECRPQAEARQVTFFADFPANMCVRGDHDRLSQVFRNLLENACRYATPGTPVLIQGEIIPASPIRHDKTDLLDRPEEKMVRLSVQDFGPGIPQSELDRIFDRFHRVEKHRGGGTGLGLAICKHIVERLGGHIHAEYAAAPLPVKNAPVPDIPVGATIRFTLPLASPAPTNTPLAAEADQAGYGENA